VLAVLLLAATLLPGAWSLADSDDSLRRQVEVLGETSMASNPLAIRNIAGIVQVYSELHYQPLWFADGPLAAVRADLVAEVDSSAAHGFNLARYHYTRLTDTALPESVRDILLTDALLSQAHDRFTGAIASMDDDWFMERGELDTVEFLRALVAQNVALRPALQALWPHHVEYWALVDKRAELAAQQEQFSETVSPGPLLRPGDSGPRVEQLQDRLRGPGDYSSVFDEQLKQAVAEFQRSAGLDADGIVGEATLEMLNANRFSWIDRVDANLERWRWLPREVPATYIRVNIAAFRLRVIADNAPEFDMDVIVGRPFRETPIFTESLKYLVFFPYWNVPYSIATKDKLPLLRKDPAPLAALGYEVQVSGSDRFVSVSAVDWSSIKPGQFTLRQQPGDKNALGRVKFMLPNTHSVYLHDTPDKALFSKSQRSFSSGCIRLAEPRKLADWILRHDSNSHLESVDTLLESGPTTTAYLAAPIPVYLVYFTAFLDGDEVVFRRDVYGRDQRIIDQLRAGQ
jgi:murein L,D-transpeptidase YcbB/YkuD